MTDDGGEATERGRIVLGSILRLGEILIDTTKVSAILKDDNHINHLGKSSTSTYFFTIIIDGQRVEVAGKDREQRDYFKEKLILELGWNRE
jgi:hypothetical protein